jgi:hypothetical protein
MDDEPRRDVPMRRPVVAPFVTIEWMGKTIRCYLHPRLQPEDLRLLQLACREAARADSIEQLEENYGRLATQFHYRALVWRPGGHSDPLAQLVSVGFVPIE